MKDIKIHPTAIIEENVTIGVGSSIWDHVHIRHSTTLGEECIVGGKTTIAYGVDIGNRVKINSFVYIPHGVTIEDGVMVSAGVVFTNDRFPRATTPDLKRLHSSAPDENTRLTLVREGATLGARCTIGSDLEIGRFAMVGMGAVVTKSVQDFHLVVGNPARPVGVVCRCGQLLARFAADGGEPDSEMTCQQCDRRYTVSNREVREHNTGTGATPSSSHHGATTKAPES